MSGGSLRSYHRCCWQPPRSRVASCARRRLNICSVNAGASRARRLRDLSHASSSLFRICICRRSFKFASRLERLDTFARSPGYHFRGLSSIRQWSCALTDGNRWSSPRIGIQHNHRCHWHHWYNHWILGITTALFSPPSTDLCMHWGNHAACSLGCLPNLNRYLLLVFDKGIQYFVSFPTRTWASPLALLKPFVTLNAIRHPQWQLLANRQC